MLGESGDVDDENEQAMPPKLYKDREDWRDVQAIHYTEAENGAVRIATSEEFIDAFAYLRAVLTSGEKSERTLQLTATCIRLNSANYTVWQYRREVLQALKKDLSSELLFSEEVILENPKNYQVWHHRCVLVEWTDNASYELQFTGKVLDDDCKNYHAWQHRQWVVSRFDLVSEDELIFSSQCIAEDFRNNSAWNYRYFIISSLPGGYSRDVLQREIIFAQEAIKKAPNNESPWNYLSGILLDSGLSSRSDVLEFCESIRASPARPSPYCLAFLVDAYVELIETGQNANKEHSDKAFQLLKELESIDVVRVKYWRYQRRMIDNLLASQ